MIETERLFLRPFQSSDAADLFEYSKEPLVGVDAGWKSHESLKESKEILKEVFLDKEGVFAIVKKNSGRVIGSVGFVEDPHRENPEVKMLGYALGMNDWGKGYMCEAVQAVLNYGFLTRNIPMISVSHYTYNIRSQKVIEKNGFRLEGILRQGAKRYDGAVLDLKCYSMSKEEFLSKINIQ